MKKHFTVFLFILLFATELYSQSAWQRIYPQPTASEIYDSYFFNASTGLIAAGGFLFKTTDGGFNWTKIFRDNSSLTTIFFLNQNTGWLTASWEILKTTDGGENWNSQYYSDSSVLFNIYFINANTGWAFTGNSLLKSTDGGTNWIPLWTTVSHTTYYKLYFRDENTGFLCWVGALSYTTNGGYNWTPVINNSCYDLKFINQLTGFAGAYTGLIYKTTNGGFNWFTSFNSGLTWNFLSLSFVDSLNGWAIGDRYGVVAKTTNCGQSWIQSTTGLAHYMNDGFLINQNTGWIFSELGDIYKTTNGGTNFFQQNKTLNSNLYSICFTDAYTGFACGYCDTTNIPGQKNIILKSTDGGLNWDTSLCGLNGFLYSIYFTNANTGFCGSSNGKIWKTTNCGIGWDSSYIGFTDCINDFYFINSATGWTATNQGLLKTTNTGINWNMQYSLNDFECVYFINENTGWAGGYWTKFVKTTNGGLNWFDQILPIYQQQYVTSTFFFDANTGFTIAASILCKTTNGGNNWTINSQINDDLIKITFKGDKGWMLGYNGTTWITSNRGETWLKSIADSSFLQTNSVFFLNQNTGWIAGYNSVILKTTDGGVWIKKNENKIAENYLLEQNYPNPFNAETKIRFNIKNSGTVILKVYDIAGREVSTLLNENMNPGKYEIIWSAENYPSGVYFYRLQAGDFVQVKKMILIK